MQLQCSLPYKSVSLKGSLLAHRCITRMHPALTKCITQMKVLSNQTCSSHRHCECAHSKQTSEIMAFTVEEPVRSCLSVILRAADLYGTCLVNSEFSEAQNSISKVSTPLTGRMEAGPLPSKTNIALYSNSDIVSPVTMMPFC